MRLRLRSLALHLLIASVFSSGLSTLAGPALAGIALFLMFISGVGQISPNLILVFLFVLIHGIVNIALEHTSATLFLKTYASSVVFFAAFYFPLRYYYPLETVFRLYLKYAVLVSIIGIVQASCWRVGVAACYDFSYLFPNTIVVQGALFGLRANSILSEPSYVAFSLGPAIFVSIARFLIPQQPIINAASACIVLMFALLSQSSTAYALIVISFIFVVVAQSKFSMWKIFSVLVGIAAVVTTLLASPDFIAPTTEKLKSLWMLSQTGDEAYANGGSSFSLYTSGVMAFQHASDTAWLGGGIGSHQLYYDLRPDLTDARFGVGNRTSAGNLEFRLLSELGVFGLALLGTVFAVGLRRIYKSKGTKRIILSATLVGICAYCMRNGSFGHYGLAFFVVSLIWGDRRSAFLKSGRLSGRLNLQFPSLNHRVGTFEKRS